MAFQLRRASQVVAALWSQHSPDLTPPQFAVLQMLDECGPLDQGTLNARAAIDKSTSTPLLDRLIRLGWVMKEPDQTNRRRQIVQLTAAGRERIEEGRLQAQAASRFFEDLLGERLETLTDLLATIGDSGATRRQP
jgi:DNA-binding MarR family transcriptional regulator